MHCFLTRLPGAAKRIHEEKAYRGPGLTAVQTWWEKCKSGWNTLRVKVHLEFLTCRVVYRFSGVEEVARAEVETFMEHCAKRWQTKEGTYQLKRRRLLPDVRDPAWARKGRFFFFCSLLLRCDLRAKKVPGRAPYSQHIIIRNWT